MNKNNNFPRMNREIRSQQVRVIDKDGNMCGVMDLTKALSMAQADNLDLVEFSQQVEPPVCKIINYSRYIYEAKKKAKEAKKKQKTVVMKEIKLSYNIGVGDLVRKVENIKQFLLDGHKVKVTLWFRGREIIHSQIGLDLFHKVLDDLREDAKIEVNPRLEGKQIMMMLAPIK